MLKEPSEAPLKPIPGCQEGNRPGRLQVWTKTSYTEYLRSEHWSALKKKKRDKSKRRCAICGSTNFIETHHLLYRNVYDIQTSDLRNLCKRCHEIATQLIREGLRFKTLKPHGIFATLKQAVKKRLGIQHANLFAPASQKSV